MNIFISTNLYEPAQLPEIFSLMNKIDDPSVGIELFPEWQSEVFCRSLADYMESFRQYPVSLHGPYYGTEHSKAEGTAEYTRSMDYFQRTLELSQRLKSRYIVYHHNNCRVETAGRQQMVSVSAENLRQLRREAERCGARIVVENAGVTASGNMLFNEEQFIHMAESIPEDILLDVGHAHANGWDLSRVMKRLAHKIIAYHVHNNDGHEDQHNAILDGTLDFAQFLADYQRYTPAADIVIEYGKQCAQDAGNIANDVAYIRRILQGG